MKQDNSTKLLGNLLFKFKGKMDAQTLADPKSEFFYRAPSRPQIDFRSALPSSKAFFWASLEPDKIQRLEGRVWDMQVQEFIKNDRFEVSNPTGLLFELHRALGGQVLDGQAKNYPEILISAYSAR